MPGNLHISTLTGKKKKRGRIPRSSCSSVPGKLTAQVLGLLSGNKYPGKHRAARPNPRRQPFQQRASLVTSSAVSRRAESGRRATWLTRSRTAFLGLPVVPPINSLRRSLGERQHNDPLLCLLSSGEAIRPLQAPPRSYEDDMLNAVEMCMRASLARIALHGRFARGEGGGRGRLLGMGRIGRGTWETG